MKFGLVGTGPWAEMCHAKGLSASDDVDFIGIYSRNTEKVNELAAKFGVQPFNDYLQMLNEVDAISFCVPPAVQVELAVMAASHGKHLLLEKPIALSSTSAMRLVEAVERANVASVVFFIFHFAEPERSLLTDLRNQVWDGGWIRWFGSAFSLNSPYKDSTWRKDKGALWDLGPHAISILLPVLGDIKNISAIYGKGDLVQIVAEHQNKTTSVVSMSLTSPEAANDIELAFYGENGIIKFTRDREDPAISFERAVKELICSSQMSTPGHVLDVNFGMKVVSIIEDIEHAIMQ
ncbi:MAG: Gfo/Idh/MocA family oxidoreductase [Firmicutes bacterium]|nr:Gfo/Idh/MocA family oxidoreductase [Bacillota bacterium]